MIWNSSPDPADPADPPDPADLPDQVSSATPRDLPSTRAGGQDDVSSKQTPSKHIYYFEVVGETSPLTSK